MNLPRSRCWRPQRARAPRLALAGLVAATAVAAHAADPTPAEGPLPPGYQLLYQQDFAGPEALADFEFSDPAAWRWTAEADGRPGALELFQQSRYRPRVRSPMNVALLKAPEFGDFILEADLLQTGREYGHRDLCLFLAAKDPANFYYVHLASRADPNAHNIFLVNDAPRTNIATHTTAGVNWGTHQWHRVRLERSAAEGLIRVFFDDLTAPIMEARDRHFDFGRIGFGSFDDTGKFARVRIWGPAPAPRRSGFFQ